MKLTLKSTGLAAFAVFALASVSLGGSIWAKASSRRVPHTDDTARKIGDILKIVVEVRTTIDSETTREMSKESNHTANAKGELTVTMAPPSPCRIICCVAARTR